MAYIACPYFKRESETFTEVSNFIFTISAEEAEIIKREIYQDVTDPYLREQLEGLVGTRQLILFTEYDWTHQKHVGPHEVNYELNYYIPKFLREKSQGRIVGDYHHVFDIDEDVSMIQVHSWHGQTELNKREPNPGFQDFLKKIDVIFDFLQENRIWYETIHGIFA